MKLLIFIFGLPLGILIIVYRQKIIAFTGKMEWAEEKLGAGGSYTLLVILGFIVWIGSMMYALGSFDMVFGFLGRFF